jgi:hypothetical protein
MARDASSGDAEFFSVVTVVLGTSSVSINPRHDSSSTVEWGDAGQRYTDHVECPGSFTLTGYRTAYSRGDWKAYWMGEPINLNGWGHHAD